MQRQFLGDMWGHTNAKSLVEEPLLQLSCPRPCRALHVPLSMNECLHPSPKSLLERYPLGQTVLPMDTGSPHSGDPAEDSGRASGTGTNPQGMGPEWDSALPPPLFTCQRFLPVTERDGKADSEDEGTAQRRLHPHWPHCHMGDMARGTELKPCPSLLVSSLAQGWRSQQRHRDTDKSSSPLAGFALL